MYRVSSIGFCKSHMPSFSIVTKTYNRLPYLVDAVRSIQAQRLEPYERDLVWEHVIYDDGSTDDTPETFTQSMPHTRYIRADRNEGIAVAANRAIRTCHSDYIFELDSDDVAPQRMLAHHYETVIADPVTEWFVCDFYRMDEDGTYHIGKDYYGWRFTDIDTLLRAIFEGKHYVQHNVFYARALFERVGGYDESMRMAEDLELYVRYLLAGSMPRYVSYTSHFHREHAGNYSRDVDMSRHFEDLSLIYAKHAQALRPHGVHPPRT